MRATLLNFRPPAERTGEFRKIDRTHSGRKLGFPKTRGSVALNQSTSSINNIHIFKNMDPRPIETTRAGTTFNRQDRFRDM